MTLGVGISCDPASPLQLSAYDDLGPGWGTPTGPSKPSRGTFLVMRHTRADVTFHHPLCLLKKLPSITFLTLVQGPVFPPGVGLSFFPGPKTQLRV